MEFNVGTITEMMNKLPVFIMVVFRMGGLFLTAPVFSHMAVPMRIKVSLAFFMALVIFPSVQTLPSELPDGFILFGAVAAKETAVGAIIGYFAALLFTVFSMAGSVIGRQIGLEMAATLSPGMQTGGSLTGFIYYITGAIIFLGVNGHHWLIKTLAFSYRAVPLAGFRYTPKLTEKITDSFALYFAQGIKIAAPFIIVGLLSLVLVGIVLKVTQQSNLFVLELPMKSLVGFTLLVVSLPFGIFAMKNIMETLQGEIVNLLRFMR